MNAVFAPPRTPTTISIACPWCAEPLAIEDAFAAQVVRCDGCSVSVDLEPVPAVPTASAIEIAA